MTKKSIKRAFYLAIYLFGFLLLVGIVIAIMDNTPNRVIFSTFKDLLPLPLGMVAAILAYVVQRRSGYQQQLRNLWSNLVDAFAHAVDYTYLDKPSQDQHSNVLIKLSTAIEEVRGVFCNLEESLSHEGLYPFEPIKDIHVIITNLGFGESFRKRDTENCRKKIFVLWKEARKEILKEFDREVPTFSHSHWADIAKGEVYDHHQIPKTPS